MNALFKIKLLLISASLLMLNIGCASSSYSSRYNKPKEQTKEEKLKPVRFAVRDKDSDENTQPDTSSVTKPFILSDIADSTEEFDEIPFENDSAVSKQFIENINKLKSFNVALTEREKMLLEVIKFIDAPYKYGGNGSKGIDCSAFTKQVYHNSIAVDIPRTAREQFTVGDKVGKDDLKFGDLVFFNTTKRAFPGHVGIYLGDNQFVHASRSLGVTVSSLDSTYYKKRFIAGRRIEEIEKK